MKRETVIGYIILIIVTAVTFTFSVFIVGEIKKAQNRAESWEEISNRNLKQLAECLGEKWRLEDKLKNK